MHTEKVQELQLKLANDRFSADFFEILVTNPLPPWQAKQSCFLLARPILRQGSPNKNVPAPGGPTGL